MQQYSVRRSLITLISVALLTLFLAIAVGVHGESVLQGLLKHSTQVVAPSLDALGVINEGQTAVRSENRYVAALLDSDADFRELDAVRLRKAAIWARIDAAWAIYAALPQSPEEAAVWKMFVTDWQAWREMDRKISEYQQSLVAGRSLKVGEAIRHEYLQRLNATRTLFDKAEAGLGKLTEINAALARAAQEQAEHESKRIDAIMFGCAILGVVLLSGMGWFLIRVVLGTLGGEPSVVKAAVANIAHGDLRTVLPLVEGDQQSLMAYQHKMQLGLRTMVGEIVDGVSRAEAAAHQLASAAEQVAIASETSSESASSMAASVEEMAVSIQLVADHTEDALKTARDAGRMSSDGGAIIESAISEINAIATAVQSTANDINSLSESSARISSIVQVIREVAEQTNLLALNAAIEAARAGESGRGFAVVADEVRKLAERTSGATAEIAQMIDRIQADTHSSVTTTEKAIAQVDRGVALASQAGQAIQQIRQSVDQVVNVVADIELAIAEQRSASQQIAQRVEQVAQVSEENGVAARQTADTAREMSALASQLQATAGSFTL